MSNPWFRLYNEWDSDPKVQSMPEVMQRRLIMLFCRHHRGDHLTDAERAFYWRISADELFETKKVFLDSGFIANDWTVLGWEEMQCPDGDRPPWAIWKLIRSKIFARDNYTCAYCGARGGKLECDHVIPVSRGGSNEDGNLVTACFPCNRSKRDKLVSEWRPS